MGKAKRGIYIIGQGMDFKLRRKQPSVGYDTSLEPYNWYVINGLSGAIVGHYQTRELAANCAILLDNVDKAKINAEIENILVSDE